MATVRGVLDPGKGWPPEWYVASDQTGIWLDLRHAWVDADDLIRDAEHAAALLANADDEKASAIFAEVDARYTGTPSRTSRTRSGPTGCVRRRGQRGRRPCATS